MRRRALPIVLLLLAAALAGCDSNGAEDPDVLLLRIENASGVEFSSVYVSFPGVEARYGTVAAEETSAYRELETAYRYGYVEVEAEGQTYRIQPIDFVGEEPLKNGTIPTGLAFRQRTFRWSSSRTDWTEELRRQGYHVSVEGL